MNQALRGILDTARVSAICHNVFMANPRPADAIEEKMLTEMRQGDRQVKSGHYIRQ